ncbi:hypothetical protein [Streptomyces sp. NPDC048581]
MTDPTAQSPSTRNVYAGGHRDPQGAIHIPLYNQSTCALDSTAYCR